MLSTQGQPGGRSYARDVELARFLAAGAGKLLLTFRSDHLRNSFRYEHLGHEQLGHEGDKSSQEYLKSALREARRSDAVLSEEAPDDAARLSAERVWIIDPLDGTREYSEGRHDWAVHVALWSKGELVAGAVALPGLGRVFGSDGRYEKVPRGNQLRIAVSRSRPPEVAKAVAAELGAQLVPMGSAGYKVSAVVTGEVDAYLHAGGQYEWDSAAPVAVARAAGLHASRIDGSQLRYNQPGPYLPDLLVCRPELSTVLLQVIQSASSSGRLEDRTLLKRNAGE